MQITPISNAWLLLLTVAALFAGEVRGDAATISVRDATGRTVAIPDASRIVSIGGSVTEILYALGQEHRIAAVDVTSLYPAQALKQKPNVGYLRQLSPEGVLGLSPTLVIAAEGAGPKETISVIEGASVQIVHVPDRFTGEGIAEKIRLIAAATGAKTRGDCLVAQVEGDLAALSGISGGPAEPRRVLFILSFINGRAMVAGRNTAADGIIRMAGARNAMADFEGYKIVTDEAIVAAKPESVLAMERPGQTLTAAEVFSHAAFSTSPAAEKKSYLAMDGLYLLGFGPRTARAARDLAHGLYPSRPPATLPSDGKEPAEVCRQ